ncbi:MAG: sodium:solute symporter [Clostridiales bacterium]|jgi:SSS family transporter|nr:sodium:solute symporter [Clostridiales bacterium]
MQSIILSSGSHGGAWRYILLALYFLAMGAIAYYSRKRSSSLDDFYLGGKHIGGWMSAFAYGTTYFSAVIFVGYAGKFGWSFGLASVWIGVGNALVGSLLAWKVLAKRTREFSIKKNAKTMPEFFKARYLDEKLKLAAAIVIFIFLIPYSASVYQGIGQIFEMVFGLPFWVCIVMMAAVTALYVFVGGYFATALTDFVQGIIMLAGVTAMVVIAFLHLNGGGISFTEVFSTLTDTGHGFFQPMYENTKGLLGSRGFNVVILTLLTSLGMWGLPQSIHKFYAVKEDGIKKASVISTLFALVIGAGAYLFGSFSTLMLNENTVPKTAAGAIDFDSIIPTILDASMSPFMLGLIVVIILAAGMSSLASVSLSGASALIMDFYKGFVKKNADEKKVNKYLRITCLVFILCSALLAVVKIDAIVTMMSLSWGTLAGCFIGPYVYGLYSKKVTRAAARTSVAGGLIITLALTVLLGAVYPAAGLSGLSAVLKGGIAFAPFTGVCAMIFSLVSVPVVSKFTKQFDEKELAEIYNY